MIIRKIKKDEKDKNIIYDKLSELEKKLTRKQYT